MSLFHKHKWIELERFYAPPVGGIPEMSGPRASALSALADRMLFGVTTIVYECSICGKMKTVEVLGKSLKESP